MRVKVTNICSEDVLPALRALANELELRMSFAANHISVDVDQIRFNTISISDDEQANKKFAQANEKYHRFKDKGTWQRELSLSLIFDPRKVDGKDGLLRAWVQKMGAQLLNRTELPSGINPRIILALVHSALEEQSKGPRSNESN